MHKNGKTATKERDLVHPTPREVERLPSRRPHIKHMALYREIALRLERTSGKWLEYDYTDLGGVHRAEHLTTSIRQHFETYYARGYVTIRRRLAVIYIKRGPKWYPGD